MFTVALIVYVTALLVLIVRWQLLAHCTNNHLLKSERSAITSASVDNETELKAVIKLKDDDERTFAKAIQVAQEIEEVARVA